jgi:hypothetical protein
LELSRIWKIDQCILAGDVVHFDKLSGWEPNWTDKGRISFSAEVDIARNELKKISGQFKRIDYVLGNHEGRLLRSLQTEISPRELLRILEINNPQWNIAPYYFSYLDTVGGRYIIEHPKNAGKFSASKLCSKYLTHILMAHSHQLNFTKDPSGKYYAIEMGCAADEDFMAYCSQRHNMAPMHGLGAVIVRNGYPWLLYDGIPWDIYAKL